MAEPYSLISTVYYFGHSHKRFGVKLQLHASDSAAATIPNPAVPNRWISVGEYSK